MADKRAYFKLDVGYLTNPKVAAVSLKSATAVLLHVGSIGYAAQHLTDGVVPVPLLLRLVGATNKDAALLYQHGLWTEIDEDQAAVHDFLEHQRSASAVKGATAHAKAAAAARWNAESNAVSMPDAEQSASEPSMHRRERGEREEREETLPRKRGHQIPDTWRPNDSHGAFAHERRLNLQREVAQFRDHHQAKGSVMKDWDAAFRTWLRNAEKWRGSNEGPPPERPSLPHASEIESPPDGLSPAEFEEWRQGAARRRAGQR